jgi:predicted alternative tryptophan synthase beta-subunit
MDPEELRQAAFQRIRGHATQQYSSRGVDLPARMSEALSQLRPPTPLEQKASLEERVNSRVQDMLAAVMSAGSSFSAPASFASAYRNKKDEAPESDKQLWKNNRRSWMAKT